MNDYQSTVNALQGKTVWITNAGHATSGPRSSGTLSEWLTPEEFLNHHGSQKVTDYLAAASVLRDLDDKRPHAPVVRWDGTQWVMSVFDPHMFPRARCSDSWSEALGFAWTWAHINRGAGLL